MYCFRIVLFFTERLRARLVGLRATPTPLTPPLFISCSDTVHRSRFSLSSFSLSLTASEPEKLVFLAPPAPAPVRYSMGARAGGSPAKCALIFLCIGCSVCSYGKRCKPKLRMIHSWTEGGNVTELFI